MPSPRGSCRGGCFLARRQYALWISSKDAPRSKPRISYGSTSGRLISSLLQKARTTHRHDEALSIPRKPSVSRDVPSARIVPRAIPIKQAAENSASLMLSQGTAFHRRLRVGLLGRRGSRWVRVRRMPVDRVTVAGAPTMSNSSPRSSRNSGKARRNIPSIWS